jgi:hypothetical protein
LEVGRRKLEEQRIGYVLMAQYNLIALFVSMKREEENQGQGEKEGERRMKGERDRKGGETDQRGRLRGRSSRECLRALSHSLQISSHVVATAVQSRGRKRSQQASVALCHIAGYYCTY